ncbi:MAG: SGNH/GDSL hydrolase family protein [Lachnospiraceae bacterium]|nr:SGNH/GDSL hydrolase family protein [Lachnospiraceae bacterium]
MLQENILTNKTIYGFGDSLIAGHFNGIGMLDYVAKSNHMHLQKYAANGASVIPHEPFSFPDMEGIVYDIGRQIDLAPETVPDFICFNGMTNDAKNPTVIANPGQITEGYDGNYDTTTFCGAFETICFKLREKYQNSIILYICPHKMPTRTQMAQDTLQSCVRKICHKWSIPYVDIYNKGGINTCIDSMRSEFSYNRPMENDNGDGTHLNPDGYRLWYAPMIEHALLTHGRKSTY